LLLRGGILCHDRRVSRLPWFGCLQSDLAVFLGHAPSDEEVENYPSANQRGKHSPKQFLVH